MRVQPLTAGKHMAVRGCQTGGFVESTSGKPKVDSTAASAPGCRVDPRFSRGRLDNPFFVCKNLVLCRFPQYYASSKYRKVLVESHLDFRRCDSTAASARGCRVVFGVSGLSLDSVRPSWP